MPAIESTMVELGTPAPDFSLPDATGNTVTLAGLGDTPALLVMFICNHCPFVHHIREELVRLTSDYTSQGVAIIAINSNDAEKYPDDSPEAMIREIAEHGYAFPYLIDAEQTVARAYSAACTPDFFLFDGDRRLAYRGQLDDSRPNSGIPVTGTDLRAALDAILSGTPVPSPQRPSIGCSIKWRPGNEPT